MWLQTKITSKSNRTKNICKVNTYCAPSTQLRHLTDVDTSNLLKAFKVNSVTSIASMWKAGVKEINKNKVIVCKLVIHQSSPPQDTRH